MLRFLADESCDFNVIRALRDAGFDVIAVIETMRAAKDPDIMRVVRDEARILLTEDGDFGTLVFAYAHETSGVIYIRFPGNVRKTVGESVVELVRGRSDELVGAFAVVMPGRVRITRAGVEP
jgi:predicted nuclease of predicted toxin-antitoxin system